jgi:hypothetical protein
MIQGGDLSEEYRQRGSQLLFPRRKLHAIIKPALETRMAPSSAAMA